LPEPPKRVVVAAPPVKPVKEPTRPGALALNEAIARAQVKGKSTRELSLAEVEALDEAYEPEPSPPRTPLPALERVQERLRAVRVGEPPELQKRVDDKLAKARLRQAAKNGRGQEMTLAEQLGLKVRRVVIDAGHGGHDSGAVGQKGTLEKDVTLQVATRLAARLTEAGLEVVLTRDDDTFVRLEDRARHANEVHGDLFISVHCNSAPGHKLRGIETYTLNTSADRYSIRLAARENASSEKGISDLQFILADLATKANTEESSRLAVKVQEGLVGALRVKHKEVRDLGTKEALFYVLLGAKMPAILVETSFLSHPEEEKLLASPAYQEELAAAIAAGVQDFLGDRQQRLAKID
ncbi:MAG: N-acetylmuramoyl-L-alanine amidase family protein, partial [Myxococcaceae bacterium]